MNVNFVRKDKSVKNKNNDKKVVDRRKFQLSFLVVFQLIVVVSRHRLTHETVDCKRCTLDVGRSKTNDGPTSKVTNPHS